MTRLARLMSDSDLLRGGVGPDSKQSAAVPPPREFGAVRRFAGLQRSYDEGGRVEGGEAFADEVSGDAADKAWEKTANLDAYKRVAVDGKPDIGDREVRFESGKKITEIMDAPKAREVRPADPEHAAIRSASRRLDYYRGRQTDAQRAGQDGQIRLRRELLGAEHGATSGQRPIYNEHIGPGGVAYLAAWTAARAKLNARHATADALLSDLFDSSKQCEWCSEWFVPERSTARFCEDRCRVYANRWQPAVTLDSIQADKRPKPPRKWQALCAQLSK